MKRIDNLKKRKLKKQNKIIKWLSITFIFSMIIFGLNHLFVKNSEAMQETITSSEIYPGLNLKTTEQEAGIYTLFVSQAITENESIDEEIDQWILQEREQFKLEVEESENILKENGFSAHLNIQTSTQKLADQLYNLELESYQIAAGANGSTKTKSVIIDLTTNEILKNKDVLTLDEETVHEIRELVFQEVEQDAEIKDFIFEELLEDALKNHEDWNLSVNQESVVFSFDQYEIAAAAAGLVHIEIPMNKMISYLNPVFADKLGLEIPEKEIELKADGKYVALTFDDGPHAEVTARVLKTLAEHEVKATFYMLGSQVDYYPSIAKEVVDQGHELGNHTQSHKDLTRLSALQIREEIKSASTTIQNATTDSPKSIRPPYGAFNDSVKEVSKELDLPIVMWSVDSLDWKSRNSVAINQEVMKNIHPGAIILLHDIHKTTADALPSLLKNLKSEGYEFVTVSELLKFGDLEGIGPHRQINYD